MICILTFIGVLLWRFFSRRIELPCPTWLSWLVEKDNPFTKTNQAKSILEHLSLKSGMYVLDAGCGPGRLTIPIAKEIAPSGEITAMDLQLGMIQRVQEKATKENLSNIHYLQAKIGNGQLELNRYDRALLVTVLGEIPNRQKALKEIWNSLKPGGILSVVEIIFDPHFQRKSTMRFLAKEAGFREIKTMGNFLAYNMLLEKL
jgi:ubiquinone/menaquinone biosynthesis C-methylase UbiE